MPENENKDQEYELEEDIEIVDDTPEADRDKGDPIDPAKAEISDEEISQYSANVQHRIREVRRAYHDERRAKEQLAREREEAIRFAQSVAEQNRQASRTIIQWRENLSRIQEGQGFCSNIPGRKGL
jgi:hypothetical protein